MSRVTYIGGGVVDVRGPARTAWRTNRRSLNSPVVVTQGTPKPRPTPEQIRRNIWRNDGYTAHSDTRAKLYQ